MRVGLSARAKAVCATAAIVLLGGAVGAQSASAQGKTLRIGWTANGNSIAVKIADVKGFYKKYGVNVQIINQAAAANQLPALGKQFEILTVTITDVLAFTNKGGDPLILNSSFVQSKAEAKAEPNLLVEKGINSLKQLKGKSICLIQAGGNGQQYVSGYIALAKAGLNPKKDVKWVSVPAPNTLDALRADRCQAAMAVNPYLNQIKATGQWAGLVNTLVSVAPIYTGSMFATSKKLVKKDPKTYRNFQKAFAEAAEYCKKNTNECIEIAMRELGLNRQRAADIEWQHQRPKPNNKWITDWIKPMQKYGFLKKKKISVKDTFVLK